MFKSPLVSLGACLLWFAGGGAPARAADPALVAAAKAEGSLNWYTTQIIDQLARPLGQAFERAYGIKVDYTRAEAAETNRRILAENQAGQTRADVFDGAAAPPAALRGIVMNYTPESARRLPAKYLDGNGQWVATNLYVYTLALNTELVPREATPKTFADLLDPRWKGKMAWSGRTSTSSAPGFVGAVLAAMGQDRAMDYLRALSRQDIAPVSVSARQLVDQTLAGEYAIAIEILNNHAFISQRQGAPVTWAPLDLSLLSMSVMSAIRAAPHPNAARLFLDFAMAPEGQAVYRDADYIPVDPATPPRDPRLRPDGGGFAGLDLAPGEVEAALPKWFAIFRDVFR